MCILLACAPRQAMAQSIIPGKRANFVPVRVSGDQAATKQNYRLWPRVLAGDTGTQVHITFSPKNADIALITARRYPESRLIDSSLKIARSLSATQAILLTLVGHKTSNVDIKLDNYLQHERRGARYAVDIDALRRGIASTDLPAPIVLCVHGEDIHAVVRLHHGAQQDIGGSISFFQLHELASWASLNMSAAIPRWGPIAAVLFVLFLIAGPILAIALPWQTDRGKLIIEATLSGGVVLLLLAPLIVGGLRHFFAVLRWCLPGLLPVELAWLIALLAWPVFILVSGGIRRLYVRRRIQRGNWDGRDDDGIAFVRFLVVFLVYNVTSCVGIYITSRFGRPDLSAHGFIAMVPFAMAGLTYIRMLRGPRNTLAVDDPLRIQCIEMAERAGITINNVVVEKTKIASASTSASGVMVLTTALLENLDADELRASVAHALGHLRIGPGRLKSAVIACFLVAIYLLCIFFSCLDTRHMVGIEATIFRKQLWIFIMLPCLILLVPVLNSYGKRAEFKADAYALALIGDPDLIIRALVKVRAINRTAIKQAPDGDKFSMYPPLAKRLEALRALCPSGKESNGL